MDSRRRFGVLLPVKTKCVFTFLYICVSKVATLCFFFFGGYIFTNRSVYRGLGFGGFFSEQYEELQRNAFSNNN